MIAVVTELKAKHDSRKIKVEKTGEIALISVGRKVGRIRLKAVLSPYGGDVVFAPRVSTRGVDTLDISEIKNEIIFNSFLEYCLTLSGLNLRVGAVIDDECYLDGLLTVINRAESTVIVSDLDLEDFCKSCLRDTGTCPFIVQSKTYLYDCDVVFSAEGLSGFSGVLFGFDSTSEVIKGITLPEYCNKALECGASFLDLAAALRKYYL